MSDAPLQLIGPAGFGDRVAAKLSAYTWNLLDETSIDFVIIVDEFTGRLMPGRRWSDGLHQAVEAKENVKIERETQTLASVTFQNFFRDAFIGSVHNLVQHFR